jgi:hypothetical protein
LQLLPGADLELGDSSQHPSRFDARCNKGGVYLLSVFNTDLWVLTPLARSHDPRGSMFTAMSVVEPYRHDKRAFACLFIFNTVLTETVGGRFGAV